ncbi:ABC transporter ATP-binding protein [Methylophaga sulfidovorans]|uniref:ABC-2 type transport system ATP-binding protein n=1 Tax=Methylophaga sulfidovorans TaxID=45496 RepID=A0A1I4A004_9GAMM|nr:ABC transporter ATP-binding protein [Methylophaga sulfidovorans]SFK49206.1 ABC-2 type transport system ATP-binding protein [Methylophaga sulfidovorans]
MLEVSKLNKFYGQNHAVDDLNFTVASGEILCLLGANGAGKTTTLNMLLGFIKPDSGHAVLDGVDMYHQRADCREQMMYIPENVHLYPSFTAVENITYLAELAGVKVIESDIKDVLIRTGITETQLVRKVGGFSKGMRQKVAIAFALLKHAKLVLMDEPTSGLDPVATQEFIEVVKTIKERGTAVLIVTHDLLCAHQLADQIGIMSHGQLKQLIKNDGLTLPNLTEQYFNQFSA